MALKIKCQEHYDKVVARAKELGILDKLQEQLNWLDNFGGEKGSAELYYDFAPLSFVFSADNGRGWVTGGGLIFYAGSESGVTGQLSVTNSGRSDSRWEINT